MHRSSNMLNLGRLLIFTLVSLFTTGGAAAAIPADIGSVSVAGLRVSGNQILNGLGQAVMLRGVNKSGTEYMCLHGPQVFDGPSDATSVMVLKSWAINVVRIPVNEHCWLGINGVKMGGNAYQSEIVNYVDLLTAANIATIIDLQWSSPGTTLADKLTPMPAADHAPAFWTSVANTFKSNSSVIFDLFNEPFPDGNQDTPAAWACLKNGGKCAGVPYRAAGMQTLLNAVRATGSTNIVMVPGIQYANSQTQWLANKPNDPANNLAAAWHSYANQGCNQYYCWDTKIKPVMKVVPVIVGEIGQNDCQTNYIDSLMNFLDANGGHYLAWAWNTFDCSSFPSLLSNYDGTPTAFGVGVRDHLLALAGQSPPALPTVPFFSTLYPFGIAVGATTRYTARDGTIYFPDVAEPAMTLSVDSFTPFSVNDAIAGTLDPTLYKTGRSGAVGSWTINVPNGNYEVTLGMAPNSSHNAGELGQDQSLQGQKVGSCVWSTYSGTNVSPGGISCPQNPTTPAPTIGVAQTVTYNVSVQNQALAIQLGAAFGDGRTTILNSIKVTKLP
jgi:hypothetical protein